jgi:hypothetical protein
MNRVQSLKKKCFVEHVDKENMQQAMHFAEKKRTLQVKPETSKNVFRDVTQRSNVVVISEKQK